MDTIFFWGVAILAVHLGDRGLYLLAEWLTRYGRA